MIVTIFYILLMIFKLLSSFLPLNLKNKTEYFLDLYERKEMKFCREKGNLNMNKKYRYNFRTHIRVYFSSSLFF